MKYYLCSFLSMIFFASAAYTAEPNDDQPVPPPDERKELVMDQNDESTDPDNTGAGATLASIYLTSSEIPDNSDEGKSNPQPDETQNLLADQSKDDETDGNDSGAKAILATLFLTSSEIPDDSNDGSSIPQPDEDLITATI